MRWILLVLYFFLLAKSVIAAQPSIDNVTTAGGDTNQLTFSHGTPDGSNRLLIVEVGLNDGASDKTVSGITYAGLDLTQLSEARFSGGGPRVEVWYRIAPVTGNNNVVITIDGSNSNKMGAAAISLSGVDQTTPLEGSGSDTGNEDNPTVTVTSETDDLVMDVESSFADAVSTEGPGQTRQFDQELGGSGASSVFMQGSTEPGATSVRMNWTRSKIEKGAMIGFNVNALAPPPTIDNVVIEQASYNPTENSTTTVRVDFNVTGINLDVSGCKCQLDNSATWQGLYETAEDTVCDNLTIDGNTEQYTCFVDMQFWYENNTYSANVTVKDATDFVHDATQTFTYNILVASIIDNAAIDFGLIVPADYGSSKTDANSPLTVTNLGNKQLELKVTGANLSESGGGPDLDVGSFYVKNDSTFAGSLQLTTSQQAIPNAIVPLEDATPGGNVEEIWWFFLVPDPMLSGTYSGTWTLVEE